MNLQRFSPSTVLQPYIREFLLIKTAGDTDSTVIPDTSLVLSFRYQGAVTKREADGNETLPAITIAGLRRSVRHFCYTGQTANLLVLFKEGGIGAFSRTPANELFDHTVAADNLFRREQLESLPDLLAEAKNDKARINLVEAFLLRQLAAKKQDLLIGNAVQLIHQHNGVIRINELAASLHLSQDPFEKRFRTLVGATPKQYASIVRLRGLIHHYPTAYTSLTEASYDAGYFDQSHFIKDFRLFTGKTPKEFFQSSHFW